LQKELQLLLQKFVYGKSAQDKKSAHTGSYRVKWEQTICSPFALYKPKFSANTQSMIVWQIFHTQKLIYVCIQQCPKGKILCV